MDELFYEINAREKEKILQFLEANTLTFKKNTTILGSVKQENIISIVVSGYLQIIKTDYNGNRTIMEELFENDIFGSTISSIKNDEYTIITKEDSKIIITRTRTMRTNIKEKQSTNTAQQIIYFDEIINNDLNYSYFNQFLKNLLKIITKKINSNNDRMEILTNKTIRNKLLAYFRIMSKKNNSRVIYLPYNYTDLADYLAIDRSAMYRELKNLKDEGLIEVKNKRITLNTYND